MRILAKEDLPNLPIADVLEHTEQLQFSHKGPLQSFRSHQHFTAMAIHSHSLARLLLSEATAIGECEVKVLADFSRHLGRLLKMAFTHKPSFSPFSAKALHTVGETVDIRPSWSTIGLSQLLLGSCLGSLCSV